MTEPIETSQARLHCCNGEPAPPHVVVGWQRFLALPEKAREAYWPVLRQIVLEPMDPETAPLLDGFCQKHEIEKNHVLDALQAGEFVLRRASAANLDQQRLRHDLAALLGDHGDSATALIADFEATKTQIRAGLMEATLAEHGKILVDLDWRVDTIASSSQGVDLNLPVVFLTLKYRDGAQLDRTTLQLTPAGLKLLKSFCDRIT